MPDKVIVTNMSALGAKYGSELKTIRSALRRLIAADKRRGFETRLVALDDRNAMKSLGTAPAVTDATDPQENKRAIDSVYKALTPDYLVILGAVDVVTHQDLLNPVYDGDDDPDRFAFSDLPYACEAGYSRKPQDFIGPTRVVGRIPDLAGGTDARYLVRLLKIAASWRSSPRAAYEAHLGISTETWKSSTGSSLKALFGSGDDLQVAPPKGPRWTASQLKRRSHFINCHGADADFRFYGEAKSDGDQPVAHAAPRLSGKITTGTVAAVECCYGSELYDPGLANGQMGICSTYLNDGAYGFLGSTTIAYGPSSGNEDADLICQYFLRRVLDGASLGRAFLEARQEFAQASAELDPFSLKTLAQFTLLGDPSVVPVKAPPAPLAASAPASGPKVSASAAKAQRVARNDRRRELVVKGLTISATRATAVRSTTLKPSSALRKKLVSLARRARIRRPRIQSFTIRRPPAAARAERVAVRTRKAATPTAFHVVLGRRRGSGPVPPVSGIVAKVVDGRIISTKEVHRR